jgi:hypothetical protein
MPTIIRRLPFIDKDRSLQFRGHSCTVRRDQIIVWLSLLPTAVPFDRASAPAFPVILDTGYNHNLLIQENHLESWAECSTDALTRAGSMYVNNQSVALYDANLWLHHNIAGRIELDGEAFPLQLPTNGGIGIPTRAPRVPLLGIRALRSADLHVSIDCQRGIVSIRSSG